VNNLSKAFVLSMAITLSGCAEEDPQQYLNEGKTLVEKGDIKSARVQFKNALQVQPKFAEAYYELALLDEKKQDWPAMKRNLQDTVRLDPNHVDAQVKLGFIQINEVDKAKERAAIALKLDPENNSALLLEGRIRLSEDDKEGAMIQVDRVLAKNPENIEAIWLQAYVFLKGKRYEDALAAINKGLHLYPKNLELGMLKVNLYKEQKMYDEVNRTYEELVALHPEDKTLRYAQLEILARTVEDAELVEKSLRNALAKAPDDILLKLALIDVLERNNVDLAEQQLKEFIQSSPEDISLKGRLGGFYVGHKKYPQAQGILEQIVGMDPTGKQGLMAKMRLVELSLLQKDKPNAERLLTEVLDVDNANSSALLMRSKFRLEKGDADGAISDLRIVLRAMPDSGQAMVGLARAYVLKGEMEVAESNWRKALEVNPANMEAIIPLVAARVERGDAARAEDLLIKAIKADSQNPMLFEMLVRVRITKKDWVGAEEAINTLQKKAENKVISLALRGVLLEGQGEYSKAIEVYKKIMSETPQAEKPLQDIARIYRGKKKLDELEGYLNAFVEQNSNNVMAHNLLGQVYAAEGKWDEANKVLQYVLTIDPKSLIAYQQLSTVFLRQGKTEEALVLYRKGIQELSDSSELMLMMAKYFYSEKKLEKAALTYEDLLIKYPDHNEAANNLADLLINMPEDPNRTKRALELAGRFKNSKNPYALDTYGWVLFKSGSVDEAVEVLKKAVKVAPEMPVFHYHLAEAYHAAGNHDASLIEIKKALLLVKQQDEFDEIERAKELLKQLSEPVGV